MTSSTTETIGEGGKIYRTRNGKYSGVEPQREDSETRDGEREKKSREVTTTRSPRDSFGREGVRVQGGHSTVDEITDVDGIHTTPKVRT